jgi:hypothetical protein
MWMISTALTLTAGALSLGAGSASAKPANLDLVYYVEFAGKPFEQQVAPGAVFKMGNPTGLTLSASGGGAITCPGATSYLTGEVMTNNTPKDKIVLNGVHRVVQKECPSTVPVGPAAAVTFQLGDETAIFLSSKLKAELVAPEPTSRHALSVQYTDFDLCEYAATKFKAKLALEPLTISISRQKLKLTYALGSRCPKTMSFSATYSPKVTGGENPLYAHLD